jgi:hypothetical protein
MPTWRGNIVRPNKPNIKRIAFQRECYEQLENYLREKDMVLNHKELLLDLAALVDALENENYIAASYLGGILQQRMETKVPEWHQLAKLHVQKDFEVPDIQLYPDLGN